MWFTGFCYFECLLEHPPLQQSVHKPISVYCAADYSDKHRQPTCIVDEDFSLLIDRWLKQNILHAHIRQKTMKKWGSVLLKQEELKQNLSKLLNDGSHSDDNVHCWTDDDVDDRIDCNECEDVSTDMLIALGKENVYHIYSKMLQEVEKYQDCQNLLEPRYNDWFANSEVENELEDEEGDDPSFEMLNVNKFHRY